MCFGSPSPAVEARWLRAVSIVSYHTLLSPDCHFEQRNEFRQNKTRPLPVAPTQPKAVLSCPRSGCPSFSSMLPSASWSVGEGKTSAPALWESCSWPEPDQKQEVIEISHTHKKKSFLLRSSARGSFSELSFPAVTTDFVYTSVMAHSPNYGGSPTALHKSQAWVCVQTNLLSFWASPTPNYLWVLDIYQEISSHPSTIFSLFDWLEGWN